MMGMMLSDAGIDFFRISAEMMRGKEMMLSDAGADFFHTTF